jgi:hypothetical protein
MRLSKRPGVRVISPWSASTGRSSLRPSADRPLRFQGFAAIVPLVTWTAYVVVGYLTPHRRFLAPNGTSFGTDGVIELYTGVPLAQALLGLLVAALLVLGRSER